MNPFQLNTPVAFIIFNRPDTTARVFSEIARARPPKLLVVADGPRPEVPGEAERVTQARSVVNRVNWPCEILFNFSEFNMGCRRRVSSGIDWIFEQVEEAIILEDDCMPNPSFFRFCQEMLDYYRNDTNIGMISGNNFQRKSPAGGVSYYFSKYVHIWGWACWRNRWQGVYDVNMRYWPEIRDNGNLQDLILERSEVDYWMSIFERVYSGAIDTWDYQWCFANWRLGRINVLPAVNLISNIGFGPHATHTSISSPLANLPTHALDFPLRHPRIRERDRPADRFSDRRCFRTPMVLKLYHALLNRFIKMVN